MTSEHQSSHRLGIRPIRRPLLLILVLIAWMALGSGVASSSGPKVYTAEFSPTSVPAGAEKTFYVKIINNAAEQNLGSANIYPPTGFQLVPNSASVDSPSGGDATVRNNIVEIRNLSLPPSASAVVSFGVDVPCTAGNFTWGIQAKQANNFNGPPGNDFTLDTSNSSLGVEVTGGCGFKLKFITQPTDAEVGATITGDPVDPDGTRVQVGVFDADDNLVTTSTAEVTLVIATPDPPPPDADLSGNVATAVEGLATFNHLSIDFHGSGYTLRAESQDLQPATSDPPFTIWDKVVNCESNRTCAASLSTEDRSLKAAMTTASSTGALLMSLGADTLDCGDSFNHAPTVVTVNSTDPNTTKTVTLTISKAFDQQQPNNGVDFYQVCYQGDEPNDAPHLLPSCVSSAPPCVASKTKTKAGDVQIVVTLPAGDPRMW